MAYKLYTDIRSKSLCYSGSRNLSQVKYTVFHYTGNVTDTAKANAKFFRDSVERKAGAHFFIDASEAYMSISLDLIANAVGGSKYDDCNKTGGGKLHGTVTNKNSWSIEMCSKNGAFEPQTLYNAALLHVAICKKFGIPLDNVCRHFDVTGKHCPEYWITGSDWEKFKGLLKSVEKTFVPNGLQNDKDYDGNWYYLDEFGAVKDYTGLAQNQNGWFYVKNGKVDFTYSGFVQNDQGWWYVDKGYIDFKHKGLFYDEKYGWWYVTKSKIAKDYTGLVENSKGWWLVDNGKIRFNYTGLYHDKTYGWWYLEKSFVNKQFTGLYNDANCGWWYVHDGKVDFTKTLIAKNQYGTWYVCKDKVMLDYSGTVTIDGKEYSVKKGKIQ